ncbi:DUF3572 domain-containing protein [Aureimonas jatrophae]|jgi:hypothetical protein|uniref:DUF3572 domain-containing protein n=1 Tax=Aureimonas jatrophae TaxID=1166073 RepID=A0A1H0LR64_9HYPH|nr:DUF3572 domain-containing protein [Aureimonas jatrophae]MBB3952703.1 hypothetical protein [Aureimonas jatrophae]SDO70688.1 Protein of unknown function [Aureimonas jatrophae]
MLELRTLRRAPDIDAEAVAIDALAFIAGDQELLGRFLDLTGLRADEIRAAAGQPGFLVGVLDFVLAHEPTLVTFCQNTATEPEMIQIARDRLDGATAR